MDPNEKTQLDALVKSFNEFKEVQYQFNTHLTGELTDISRGLYGDKKNNKPGIIDELAGYDRQLGEIRLKVRTIEKNQYRTRVWYGVGSAAFLVLFEFFRTLWK